MVPHFFRRPLLSWSLVIGQHVWAVNGLRMVLDGWSPNAERTASQDFSWFNLWYEIHSKNMQISEISKKAVAETIYPKRIGLRVGAAESTSPNQR